MKNHLWGVNGDAPIRAGAVVMVPVEEHAEAVADTVAVKVAKETAGDYVLVHVEIRVLVDARETVGDRLAKTKDEGGVNSVWHQPTLFNEFTNNRYYQ